MANPTPEIFPEEALAAGAAVVATGRSDFPNQVNNSVCFPGILKGALLVRAKKITDGMAIRAAHSLADFAANKKGFDTEHIMPTMDDSAVFAEEAADVAMQAVKEGVARVTMTRDQVLEIAKRDIKNSRELFQMAMDQDFVKKPPMKMLEDALAWAVNEVK